MNLFLLTRLSLDLRRGMECEELDANCRNRETFGSGQTAFADFFEIPALKQRFAWPSRNQVLVAKLLIIKIYQHGN
jgi:hypothetical protein